MPVTDLQQSSNPVLTEALQVAASSRNPVFFTRAIHALSALEASLPKRGMDRALAAPSDYLVLVRALSSPEIAAQLAEADPMAAARLRGAERKQVLLALAGGAVSSGQAAALLSMTRQGVDKRRTQNQLIALTQGRRGYVYPVFQFHEGGTLPGLAEVLNTLDTRDGWMQLVFFMNGNSRLGGRSPAEVLRAGSREEVILAAQSFGEHGAE